MVEESTLTTLWRWAVVHHVPHVKHGDIEIELDQSSFEIGEILLGIDQPSPPTGEEPERDQVPTPLPEEELFEKTQKRRRIATAHVRRTAK